MASAKVLRRRHFSGSGLIYIVVVALLGLGALNSQNNMLFFAFGLALAGALISGVVSGGILVNLSVERLPPRTAQVGVPMHVGYVLRNGSRWLPAFAIGLLEIPRRRRRSEARTEAAVLPPPRAFVDYIPVRSETRIDAVVVPTRRGLHTFHAVRASTSFPLGITRKSVTFLPDRESPPARCIVRPEVVPLRPEALRRVAAVASEGERSSPSIGQGDEFFSIREYAPGDSSRQIAWRPSARTGQLLVRENAALSPVRLWVGVVLMPDETDPVRADQLNERALSLAASLIARAGQDGAEVGLAIPSCALFTPPRHGVRHAEKLLDQLAVLDVRAADHAQSGAFPLGSRAVGWILVHATEQRPQRAPRNASFIAAGRPDALFNPALLENSPTWR